jgi:hypothetical protein
MHETSSLGTAQLYVEKGGVWKEMCVRTAVRKMVCWDSTFGFPACIVMKLHKITNITLLLTRWKLAAIRII